MDFFIFADGYLQENETNFTYTIPSHMFHSLSFINELKGSNDSYGLQLEDIQQESDETHFIYKREEEYSLLDDVKQHSKPKIWKKKRDWIAYSIVYGVEHEANKGFFLLPIPENFLIGTERLQFIYKATKDMPVTGFDPTQLFTHLKRLVLYIYSEGSFSDLLEQKEAKTSDEFLVSLANTANYEELRELIPFKPPREKVIPPVVKKEQELPVLESENKPETEKRQRTQPSIQLVNHSEPKIEPPIMPTATRKKGRVQATNKLVLVLSGLLILFVLTTGYLLVDKLTYPSQVQLLKAENAQLIEKVEKNETKIAKLEKENTTFDEQTKELTKENKELQEEIETNVSTIKELVNKNDELKKEIKK